MQSAVAQCIQCKAQLQMTETNSD